MTVEDLFESEVGLRKAARDYAEVSNSSNAKALRAAARAYAQVADTFEIGLKVVAMNKLMQGDQAETPTAPVGGPTP